MTDYYINANTGNNANSGLAPGEAWATLDQIELQITFASDDDVHNVYVAPGLYDTVDDYVRVDENVYAAQINIIFEPGVTMDGAAINALEIRSGFIVLGSAGVTMKVFGNGLTIQNYNNAGGSPQGFDTSENGRGYLYDATITGCRDGVSGHGTSFMYLKNVVCTGNTRSTFPMVDTCTYVFEDCTFTKDPAALFQLSTTNLNNGTLNRCVLNPNGTQVQFNCESATFNNCIIGDASNSVLAAGEANGAVFNDCYGNFSIRAGTNKITMRRCYGRLSLRPQNGTAVVDIQHCVWMDSSDGSNEILYLNYDPGTCAQVIFNNNIILDTAAFDALTAGRADQVMDGPGTTFHNNLFFGGSGYSAIMLAADNGGQIAGTVSGQDPLVRNADGLSTDQNDYSWFGGSPAIGAGVGGVDIGLPPVRLSAKRPGFEDESGRRNRRLSRFVGKTNDVSYRLGRYDAPAAGTYDNKRRSRYL